MRAREMLRLRRSKVAALEESASMLKQQVESLKGVVSSSESQQAETAKAQTQQINALQEQVLSLKASADKAESECTSVECVIVAGRVDSQGAGGRRFDGVWSLLVSL